MGRPSRLTPELRAEVERELAASVPVAICAAAKEAVVRSGANGSVPFC